MEILGVFDEFFNSFLEYKVTRLIVGAIVAWLFVLVVQKLIHNFFKRTDFLEDRKEKTLESIIVSLAKYSAVLGYIFFAFSVFEVDFGRILAGAGIIGIIVGFGAQSLIKDLLAGIFFLSEKQLHKGDFIAINGKYTGTVEEIGLRFLKVREWSGKLLTISNGEVKEIQNYNIDRMRVIERVTVSFYENPTRIFEVLENVCKQLNEEQSHYLKKDLQDQVIEPFQVYGMTSLNSNFRGYEYTIVGLVFDPLYWEASRVVRKVMADAMYREKVQMAEENLLLKKKASHPVIRDEE